MGSTISRLAAVGAFLASAATLRAQDKPVVTQKESDAVRVTTSGRVNLDYIYRAREVTAYTDSLSNPTGVSNAANSRSEDTFEGETFLRLDVELSSKVNGTFEVGTKRIDGPPAVGPSGIQRWGDAEALQVKVREANIVLGEFVIPQLTIQTGITTWNFTPRGKGGSLAFDPRHSQTIRRNFDSVTDLNASEDGDAHFTNGAFNDELDPVGIVFAWGEGPSRIELVLLPGMIEHGSPSADEALYALDYLFKLDDAGSRVGVIVGISPFRTTTSGLAPNDNEHAQVYTMGGGGTVMLLEKALEIYAEGYLQRGKVGELATGGNVYAKGYSYQVGFEWHYTVANPMPIWLGVNHFNISGQREASNTTQNAGRFSAYESVADLMIIEDPYFGFDWDSNIMGIKIMGGCTFSAAAKDDLAVTLVYGHLRTPQLVDADKNRYDLGDEIDVKAVWTVNKQFLIKFSLGVLWNSELLRTALDTDLAGTTVPGSNPGSKDHTWIYTFGFDLTF